MRKITSLMALLFAFVVTAMAQSGGYPINFDKDANATRANDRPLNAISLTAAGAEKQTLTVNPAKAYNDLTTGTKFTCEPGATLKAEFAYAGIWMHGYVYLDADNDGEFSFDASQNNQAGKDLVSYSFYGPTSENYGYNSAEKYISGDARSTVDCPEFKAPEVAGEYRMRFKIDWNSVDAGGCVDASNHILNNGGYIVDATLVVEGAVEPEPEPEVPGTPAELAETYNGKVSMEFFGSPYELNAQIVFGKDENGAAKEGYATLKIWETENFNVEVVECVPYEVTATTVVLKGVTVGAGDGSVDTKQVDLTFVVNADGTLSCSEKVYGPTPDTAFLQFDFGAGVFTPETVEPVVPATPLEFVKAYPEVGSEVSSLSSITLTFNKELASVNAEAPMFWFVDDANMYDAEVQINATDAKTLTITLAEEIKAAGKYTVTFSQGALVAADGTSNETVVEMAWTVKAAPVEPEVPVATLEPVSVDPAEPEWWDAMEDIENIAINFPEEITYNAEKPVTVVFNSEEYVEVSVAVNADDAKQLVVTFPKNLKIGEYVVNVPEGAVVAANGAYNPALTYTYNVYYAYNTFEPTSITPAAGKVESLKEIVLDFGPSDYPGTNGLDMEATFELTNAQGETVATGKLSYSGWTAAAVTLDKEITELGLYTITIPEGVIWNSKVDGTADRGVHKGARCNPTIELVYSIGEAATVTEVTPVPGYYEEIPADIAVTFSKEISTVNYLILRNENTGMRGYYFAEDEYKVEGNKLSFSLPADMIEFAASATVQIQVMDKDGFPVTYAASEDDMAEGYVMLVYTAPVHADLFTATKVDPKEGEVTELSVFNVTFESLKSSEGMSYVGGFDESKVVEVLDAEGNQVATAEMEVVNSVYREEYEGEVYEFEYPSSVAKFTLNKTITEPGTYTFVIPEATVFNEGYYPDSEDFGIGWGALYNPEVRLVYTIKDASAISGVEVEAANGKVYNLQGVRVGNKLQKGVYIVNGKKVYVK